MLAHESPTLAAPAQSGAPGGILLGLKKVAGGIQPPATKYLPIPAATIEPPGITVAKPHGRRKHPRRLGAPMTT